MDFTGSGLSMETLERLAASPTPGMHILFGTAPAGQLDARFTQLSDALRFWQHAQRATTPIDESQWQLTAPQRHLLTQFLARLCATTDYTNASVRPHLVARVYQLIVALDNDADLRAQALDCISQALESCNDRVILVMNQLELAVRVHQAEQGGLDGKRLKQLMLGLMQLDIVHAHARAKVTSLRFVDEVEVFLAYEIGLRDVLHLPVSTQTMLFAHCARISTQDLTKAKRAAQKAVADADQVAAYLAASSPWQHHLRRLSAAAWSWDALKPRAVPGAPQLQTLRCPLTLEPYDKLLQPLVWQHAQTCVVYEAAEFLKHWVAHGFEPTTRQRIGLEALVRADRRTHVAK
jgi:hypothetical protein